MNERIKYLAKDHLVHERFTTYGESIQEDYYEMYPDELEKFAELIVRECCFIGEQWANGLLDPRHYAFVNKMVRRYFGVEE